MVKLLYDPVAPLQSGLNSRTNTDPYQISFRTAKAVGPLEISRLICLASVPGK
jgi:hypothetical protein